ncbi:XRE family transcriptional regulator [Rhizobium sp. TH2]|uniref:helix-turn-helix domain-containing protein n=1 Tax=Rhizobium sp. TH2 TaxID=2775403 RepID=UPI00215796A4|nr:helix-turn-helix transcriptional regulator [Rhizobium sp. TH2]UVC10087.1 XRE family transcriptional regulator [Rhizobium sp. TH2]
MDIEYGSTNVFADLGLPDAVGRQTKTRLALEINTILKGRKLRQTSAASLLGIPQSKVSALVNYRLEGFSVERLMGFLTSLNQDIEIMIRPSRSEKEGHVSVHALR